MKKPYLSPTLTVAAFRTEKGYAESGSIVEQMTNPIDNQIELMLVEEADGNHVYRETETFIEHNDWQQGNNGFWF